jgi:hypothetical protein
MYLTSHGGKSWKAKPGAPAVGFSSAAAAGWGVFRHGDFFTVQTLETKPMS